MFKRMKLKTKSLSKYIAIGLTNMLIVTLGMYIGREIMHISVLILSPCFSMFGFIFKFLMYDKTKMIK